MTTKEIWDTAAEFGVSYAIAKRMLERENRYQHGLNQHPFSVWDEVLDEGKSDQRANELAVMQSEPDNGDRFW